MSHPPLERSALERALVRQTPLVQAPGGAGLDRVLFKLENLQRTGSFKLRGAARKVANMGPDERARGVVTASAGNHGAGLALAAARANIAATVIVPEHTPAIKCTRIAGLGADLRVEGENYDQSESIARELARERGAIFVSPFDDPDVIAGNGATLADEILAQCERVPGVVLCPVGGGGLIAGLGQRLAPRGVRVIGVQPAVNCAMHDSLERGHALTEYQGQPTVAEGCDGAVAERTFQAVRAHAERIVLVSEDAIERAVAFAYRELGAILECSGAVALAAILDPESDHLRATGDLVCVLTGGNIEPDALDAILRAYPVDSNRGPRLS